MKRLMVVSFSSHMETTTSLFLPTRSFNESSLSPAYLFSSPSRMSLHKGQVVEDLTSLPKVVNTAFLSNLPGRN